MMAGASHEPQVVVVLLVAVLLCSLVGGATSASTQQCHDEDQAALLAVSSGLGSPYQLASSWSPDTWCCDWDDVDCDNSTGRVVGLSVFQDGNVSGGIPDAIGNLSHLRTLVLHHLPGLSGGIPESLAQLGNLSVLTISYTGVSGPVPSFLSQLTALTTLDLSYNSLTGAIPASLADLPNLSDINLSRNRLTGALPPLLLSKAPQVAYLRLSHNNLSGGIPAEFAGVRFAHVDLSRNVLSGDAAALLGSGKALQHLDLSRNGFRFSMSGVELPEQVRVVDVSHNGIRGRIPAQVAQLTELQVFNVSYNRLCGALPAGGNMPTFDVYSFQHNKCLCGAPLPACPR